MAKLIKKLSHRLKFYIRFFLCSKANLIEYLRSQGAQIGENCSLLGGISTFNSAEPYLIHIGDDVTIAQGAMLLTHDGGTRVFRYSTPSWTDGTVMMGTVEIGNNVFIGAGSIILPNTKIGCNVVIGAGAVVSKDIPSNVVAVGVPAVVVSTIEDYQDRCLKASITIPDEYLKNRRKYLANYYWNE